MSTSEYFPNLPRGIPVRLIADHPKNGQQCTIIGALPNPSKLAKNQWYDVRFDDYSMGRFVERYLVPVAVDQAKKAA